MAAFLLPLPGAMGGEEPRGGGDAVWGSGDGPQFLPGSSCGLGLEEPQVRAVRVMEAAPPCKGVGAAGGAGAALPRPGWPWRGQCEPWEDLLAVDRSCCSGKLERLVKGKEEKNKCRLTGIGLLLQPRGSLPLQVRKNSSS